MAGSCSFRVVYTYTSQLPSRRHLYMLHSLLEGQSAQQLDG